MNAAIAIDPVVTDHRLSTAAETSSRIAASQPETAVVKITDERGQNLSFMQTVALSTGVAIFALMVASIIPMLINDQPFWAAVGLGAYLSFWLGLGFGFMMGGIIWATRNEESH